MNFCILSLLTNTRVCREHSFCGILYWLVIFLLLCVYYKYVLQIQKNTKMKKQLRQKLKRQSKAELIESHVLINHNINQNQRSIIHQLDDILVQQLNHNDHILLQNIKSSIKNNRHAINPYSSTNKLKRYGSGQKNISVGMSTELNSLMEGGNCKTRRVTDCQPDYQADDYQFEQIFTQRSRRKILFSPSNQYLGDKLYHVNYRKNRQRSNRLKFMQMQQKQRRDILHQSPNSHFPQRQPQTPYKPKPNPNLNPKTKQYLYNSILKKCKYCNEPKSQVLHGKLVCSDRRCRVMHFQGEGQDTGPNGRTFSIGSVMHEMEFPSCTLDELNCFCEFIDEEIGRVQLEMKKLMDLQTHMQAIIKVKKQVERNTRDDFKHFINSISSIKFKKYKQNQKQITQLSQQLNKIHLDKIYQQFHKWSQLNSHTYSTHKTLSQQLNKYKPTSLKQITSQIAEQLSQITDNFKNTTVVVRSSVNLSYCFGGFIDGMVIYVEGVGAAGGAGTGGGGSGGSGSGQDRLKRDNFLLIEGLGTLQLVFQGRKSSLELRELFNILPNCGLLKLNFDYKLNSNTNCQTFPLITKSFQLSQNSLQLTIQNARPQIIQDLLECTKLPKPRSKLTLSISLHPSLSESQYPEHCKSVEEGTRAVINLLRNVGNRVTHVDLKVPFRIDMGEICGFVVGFGCCLLGEFRVRGIGGVGDRGERAERAEREEMEGKQHVQSLLHNIVNKRKILLTLLYKQKKINAAPLKKFPLLSQSVMKLLY